MSRRLCSLSQSLGAVQSLQRYYEQHPRALDQRMSAADQRYIKTGLAGAIETLQWLSRNEAAIKAAFAALEAARARDQDGREA